MACYAFTNTDALTHPDPEARCNQTSFTAPPLGAEVLIVMLRTLPAGLAPLFTTMVPVALRLVTAGAAVAVTLPELSVTSTPAP